MMARAKPPRQQRRRSGTATPTMADVAREAGVSAQTVSRALRDPRSVLPATLVAVEEAIQRTHYVQNLAASHLASNRSMMAVALVPTLVASIFARTLQGLTEVLEDGGYRLYLANTGYDMQREEQLIRSFLGRRPDGIFLVGTGHSPAAEELLRRAGVPVVEAWEWSDEPLDMVVGFRHEAAAGSLVDHLFARGRRRPVFAAVDRPGDLRLQRRRQGFLSALRRHNAGPPRLVLQQTEREFDMQQGVDLLAEVLERHPEADSVLFQTDVTAAGALLEAQRRGIAVPDRLAIVGFGDTDIASHLNPGLTTVHVPSYEIGRCAGEMLLTAMRGERPSQPRRDLGFTLVERGSS